jgi:dTDP-4-dehydrorhamnose 3,5-epimerase
MIFIETELKGVWIIKLEPIEDERGFFARTFCQDEFKRQGLNVNIAQCNLSYNRKKSTLRGMHYQAAPYGEAKLVGCIRGAIYDVVIDIRPYSKSFKQWISVELTDENRRWVYIPEGLAHGFLTLRDHTEVFYQVSEFYRPEFSCGIRWNDPAFSIDWPYDVVVISEKDKNYPDHIL